ncbi:hypothetical protein B9Z55_008735 [Caenorhabditis nigoni]|nr:hypothetical protein B9Z55_008735 [Caenorhabditis nigoni]
MDKKRQFSRYGPARLQTTPLTLADPNSFFEKKTDFSHFSSIFFAFFAGIRETNAITIILLCSSLLKVKKMIAICDGISASAHWLSRTAVRAGIGETARVTIQEYAGNKPELKRLLR